MDVVDRKIIRKIVRKLDGPGLKHHLILTNTTFDHFSLFFLACYCTFQPSLSLKSAKIKRLQTFMYFCRAFEYFSFVISTNKYNYKLGNNQIW